MLQEIRKRADAALHELDRQNLNTKEFFDQNGFLRLQRFSDASEVEAMKAQMKYLVETEWFKDDENKSGQEQKKIAGFTTESSEQIQTQGSDCYFLNSADKVHFFAETSCLDTSSGKSTLSEKYQSQKIKALNKAGHGLHLIPGVFRNYTLSDKIKALVKTLGWIDPVVPQSMHIFKQAKIGGEVTSHQDSTFLYTTPRQTCLGLWLALDDANVENGCLWVRPQSHLEPVRRKYVRNPEYFENGDKSKPQMIFKDAEGISDSSAVEWEGKCIKSWSPSYSGLFDAGFTPIECKAGDLIVFPGQLDHLSLTNTSKHPRHTFQLHLIEGENAGITWSPSNWLQYPGEKSFLSIKC